MRYERCKCGKVESWGSISTQDCNGCKECKTTLASHPDNHRQLEDHDYIKVKVDSDVGEAYKIICSKCHKRKEK